MNTEKLITYKPFSINKDKVSKRIKNQVVIVTGGAGSIGSELICQISKFNPSILIVIDHSETALHQLTLIIKKAYHTLNFHPIIGDIRNKKRMAYIFETYNPDIVYHCAAYKHVSMMESNPLEAVSVNIEGTKILVDLSIKYHTKHFIMISTDKAVHPSTIMGATKRAAEKYIQSLHSPLNNTTECIITRFGNVLGSNGSVVPLFMKQIKQGGPLTVTHPDATRYFVKITVACQLILESSTMRSGGAIFVFNMGKAVKIMDLAKKMICQAGYIPEKDIQIKITGLQPGEKLHEKLYNTESTIYETSHEKIMRVKENNQHHEGVSKHIKQIIKAANKHKLNKVIQKLKEIVPEYKSLNPLYEN